MFKMITRNARRQLQLTDIKLENIVVASECKLNNSSYDDKPLKKRSNTVARRAPKRVKQEVKSVNEEFLIKIDNFSRLVGAHVSAAGGLKNGPINAAAIGAKSFALFLKSQRTWNSKALEDKTVLAFKEQCQKFGYTSQCILPHGSYLLNCGSPKKDVLDKSRATLIDELQRCEKLGITLYNFHPGSTCGEIDVDKCISLIGESINLAHSKTKFVITVIENMSCQGNTVGGKFQELKQIIDHVQDKTRIGVCLDTCHAFAAGYDVSTAKGFDKVMNEFDSIIGLKYLRALHLNDSKGKLGCRLDRHENIGKGHIGKKCFEFIMNDPRFVGIPMILETPCDDDSIYKMEIEYLLSLEKCENSKLCS